jgi:predicted CXXCH cytochrome family protein
MKNLKPLFAAALLLVGAPALAVDTPHDGSVSSSVTECQSCHRLHGGGGTLTQFPSNNDACLTCHDSLVPIPNANHLFTPAWSAAGREGTPGTGGDQHRWSGSPTGLGAQLPLDAGMAGYLAADPNLQCAVCHDTHGKKDALGMPTQQTFAPNSPHASYRFGVAMPPNGGGGGRMKLVTVTDGGYPPLQAAYAIRIKAGNTLEISHDYKKLGAAATWVSTIPFTVGDTSANDVGLDDPSVMVRFTAAPAVGNVWEFYVSYPFLRAPNDLDQMCLDCHRDRDMNHLCVEGGAGCTAGTGKVFSHPVKEALNANAQGYDVAAPLDADGSVTSSTTDGLDASAAVVPNPSNDLKLVGGQVGCTTCHAPHNADSNSLSVDVR